LGTVIVTLRPARSTHPVARSGWAASGEAATQIVWCTALTKVTRRLPFVVGWLAAGCAVATTASALRMAIAAPASRVIPVL